MSDLHAQNTLNEKGINDIQLGTNVSFVKNLKPIRLHPQFEMFSFLPNETNFYYKELCGDNLNWKSLFVFSDSNNIITKIFLFIDDTDNSLFGALDKTYGKQTFSGESSIQNVKQPRIHAFWETRSNATVYVLKRNYKNKFLDYPLTQLSIYYSNPQENFNDNSINIKPILTMNKH